MRGFMLTCLLLMVVLGVASAVGGGHSEGLVLERSDPYRVVKTMAANEGTSAPPLQNGTWLNVSSPAGNPMDLFFFNISGLVSPDEVEDYLLFVSFNVTDPLLGSYVSVVFTSEFATIGALDLDPNYNRSSSGAIFCWSSALSPSVPTGYYVSMLHPVGPQPVTYELIVALVVRALKVDTPQADDLRLSLVYWYFDVTENPDTAPLQVSVNAVQPQDKGTPKTLALYFGCPGRLSAGSLFPPELTATFYDQVRITVSKGEQALRKGRWFIRVQNERSDEVVLETTYGMPYANYGVRYGLTFLVFILACPAICAITLALVWSVQPSAMRIWKLPEDSSVLSIEWSDESSTSSDEADLHSLDGDDRPENQHLLGLRPSKQASGTFATPEQLTVVPRQHAHYWELTLIVALVFFTPAIQILIGELLFQSLTGDQDVCYYNDLCERPVYSSGLLMYAFNNVYSNVGYLIAGFTMVLYITFLRYKLRHLPKFMPNNYSILWALCICLVAIGINSGTYHLCPSRVGFQVDSAMMLGFALLSLGDIWRRYFSPHLHGWRIFLILAILLLINYIGTIIDTYPTLIDRKGPKYWFRGILTALVGAAALAFLLYIWLWRQQEKYRKTNTVLLLLFIAPIIGLLWWDVDTDLSQTLLGMFIFLYAISVAADFSAQIGVGLFIENGRLPRVCRWCPEGRESCFRDRSLWRRLRTALLIIWLFSGWAICGLTAVYYFSWASDTNKDLSPAQSRNLNSPCIIADYYSTHDLWHFLSALWLLFQLMINAHIGHGLENSRAFEY